jgi:hypothetical protein
MPPCRRSTHGALTSSGRGSPPAPPSTPHLSPERAFVVQLERARSSPQRTFRGRVEHLSSGDARHFGSLAELLAFMSRFA